MAPSKLPLPLPLLLATLAAVLLPAPPGAGAGAISITQILSGFPEFSTLSTMLADTNVALAISRSDKVTVLAPNNTAVAAAFGGLARVPRSLLADLLALHVVLDYVDEPKLGALQRGRRGDGSVLTTLLQAMRAPPLRVGFLRVFSGDSGRATFTSAAPGARRNATVERQLAAQPSTVAVLQVSSFVFPPGIRVPRAFPPRASRSHMAAPPTPAPAPAAAAPAPAPQMPIIGSGPLVPSPVRPVPTPNLTDTPPPAPVQTGVIPIPSGHGGMAAKVESAAGHTAASWWSGVAVAIGIATCLSLHL